MRVFRIRSWNEYLEHRERMAPDYARFAQVEARLLPPEEGEFTVAGYSYTAAKLVDFLIDYSFSHLSVIPNHPLWREHLVCPLTFLNNRMRASVQLFDLEVPASSGSRIYLTERVTPLYRFLAGREWGEVTGSEYLGDEIPLGASNAQGVRNEDLTALSFPDASFDRVLSFECFEHIADHLHAFRECHRILDESGSLLFSVPFEPGRADHLVRARLDASGEIRHLLPPEIHPDPVRKTGSLSFRLFGWSVLDELREIGFEDAYALLYWSRDLGYLGGEQVQFVATKGSSSRTLNPR